MHSGLSTKATKVGLACKILPGSSVPGSDPKHQGEPRAPGFEKRPPLSHASKIGRRAKEVAHLCGAKQPLGEGGLA